MNSHKHPLVFELVWTTQEKLKGEVYFVSNFVQFLIGFVKEAWANSDIRIVFFEEAFRSQFGMRNREASVFSSFLNYTKWVRSSIRYLEVLLDMVENLMQFLTTFMKKLWSKND